MVKSIKNYLSLVTFAHTVFAMPFALIGFFIGLRAVNYETYKPWWATLNISIVMHGFCA